MQLLTALDLHHNNVLFLIPGMESWTTDDVRYYLGEPKKTFTARLEVPLSPGSNLPKYVVRDPDISESSIVSLCLKSATIKIM